MKNLITFVSVRIFHGYENGFNISLLSKLVKAEKEERLVKEEP